LKKCPYDLEFFILNKKTSTSLRKNLRKLCTLDLMNDGEIYYNFGNLFKEKNSLRKAEKTFKHFKGRIGITRSS